MSVVDRVNALSRKVPTWAVYTVGAVACAVVAVAGAVERPGGRPGEGDRTGLGRTRVAVPDRQPVRHAAAVGRGEPDQASQSHRIDRVLLHCAASGGLGLAGHRGCAGPRSWPTSTSGSTFIVGMIGLLAMLPLAVTSSDRAIRAMGPPAWGRLHRLAYVAGSRGRGALFDAGEGLERGTSDLCGHRGGAFAGPAESCAACHVGACSVQRRPRVCWIKRQGR